MYSRPSSEISIEYPILGAMVVVSIISYLHTSIGGSVRLTTCVLNGTFCCAFITPLNILMPQVEYILSMALIEKCLYFYLF